MAALLPIQVAVARAERQAIGLANRGADAYLQRQVEIADQLLNDPGLLKILLTEIGHVRLHDVEELANDRRHPTKVARPRRTAEHILQLVDLDVGMKIRGIHSLGRRREDQVDTLATTDVQIGLQGARVAAEVLPRTKLRGIDEDRHDDETALRTGGADQAGMAGMQRAHGGYETQLEVTVSSLADRLPHLGNGRDQCSHLVCPFWTSRRSSRYERRSGCFRPSSLASCRSVARAALS